MIENEKELVALEKKSNRGYVTEVARRNVSQTA